MNSVKIEVTPSTVAGELRLLRQVSRHTILLVEGDSDARMRRRFTHESCTIKDCNGKEFLISTYGQLRTWNIDGVVALLDKDYDEICNVSYTGVIFLTDDNDLDITVIKASLSKLLDEFSTAERLKGCGATSSEKAFSQIAREAAKLGRFRLANRLAETSANFQSARIRFENNSFRVKEQNFRSSAIDRQEFSCADKKRFDDALAHIEEINIRDEHLCNGHDCARIIGKALKTTWGSVSDFDNDRTGASLLLGVLRMSFHEIDLASSGFYNRMLDWQKRNSDWPIWKNYFPTPSPSP